MKDRDITSLDPVRRRILDRIAEMDDDLANISRAVGKNHAYLHQFIWKGSPRVLPEDTRGALARKLKLSESELGKSPVFDITRMREVIEDTYTKIENDKQTAAANDELYIITPAAFAQLVLGLYATPPKAGQSIEDQIGNVIEFIARKEL